jgi:molybdopterin synthase sulfur carrier subunit
LPPKVRVRLFHELRETVGESELEIEANTLSDVVESLINRQGSLKELFFDSKGSLRQYILFYLNNRVQNPPNLTTKLSNSDLVLLIPPAAGG